MSAYVNVTVVCDGCGKTVSTTASYPLGDGARLPRGWEARNVYVSGLDGADSGGYEAHDLCPSCKKKR